MLQRLVWWFKHSLQGPMLSFGYLYRFLFIGFSCSVIVASKFIILISLHAPFICPLGIQCLPRNIFLPPTKTVQEDCLNESDSRSVVSDSLRPYGLSMEFSRPEYWSGLPFPSPGYRPNPGMEPRSPALQADSLPAEPQRKPLSA